jgi:uncharacterized protein YukE
MSSVEGAIGMHKAQMSARRRMRLQVESMWADAAAQKYFDIVDQLERADRAYLGALAQLNTTLDFANQLLAAL